MSKDYGDLPIQEALTRANNLIHDNPHVCVFFKFTCEKCGSRQTFDVPNALYESGSCEECGYVTKLKKVGFMAVFGITASEANKLLHGDTQRGNKHEM